MVKNKLLSLGLAVVMTFSASVTAFAGDSATTSASPDSKGKYGSTVNVSSSTVVPTIDVTVPTAAAIIINPYNIQVKTDSLTQLGDTDTGLSIISPTYTITSKSNIGLNVDVTVQGVIPSGSGVRLATKALTGKETLKCVFLYFEIKAEGDTFKDSYDGSSNQIILSKNATTKKAICFIAAAKEGSTSEAECKFFGAAVPNPKTAWTENDKVTATIKFKFTPVRGTGA